MKFTLYIAVSTAFLFLLPSEPLWAREGNLEQEVHMNGYFNAGEDSVYHDCDIMPEYIDGLESLVKLITEDAEYPDSARSRGIEGKVYISFIIERDGTPSTFKLVEGLGYGCDEEALKVIKRMAKWTPGKIKDSPVRVRLIMPIIFSPESGRKNKQLR